jgi:hypothetical protein
MQNKPGSMKITLPPMARMILHDDSAASYNSGSDMKIVWDEMERNANLREELWRAACLIMAPQKSDVQSGAPYLRTTCGLAVDCTRPCRLLSQHFVSTVDLLHNSTGISTENQLLSYSPG